MHVQVLILHQFFNTPERGGPLRSYYLATALRQAGHSVHVVTTHNQPKCRQETVEGIDVHYLPVTYNNRYGFFRRIYSFLRFVIHIIGYASKFKNVSVCYAISAPLTTGLAAIVIKWRYGIPYVFEVGDLWPEAPIQLGIVRNALLKIILFRLEAAVYRRALSIVALSSAISQNIGQRFPNLIVHELPNMADTKYFEPGTDDGLKEKYGLQNRRVISYIGTMGLANGLDFVLDCAEACEKKMLPVTFVLCGEGAKKDTLQQAAFQRNLQNVLFLPFQNREGVREVFRLTDIALVCFQPLPILGTGSPNKYFDALAAGKVIAVNFNGWIRDEIEQHACGFYAANGNTFVQNLIPYLDDQVLKKSQTAARQLAFRYDRTTLGKRFVQLLESTVSGM